MESNKYVIFKKFKTNISIYNVIKLEHLFIILLFLIVVLFLTFFIISLVGVESKLLRIFCFLLPVGGVIVFFYVGSSSFSILKDTGGIYNYFFYRKYNDNWIDHFHGFDYLKKTKK